MKIKLFPILLAVVFVLAAFGEVSVLNREAYESVQRNSKQQTVQAREEDCLEAEVIRRRGRARAAEEREKLPEDEKLLHLQPSEKLVELAEKKKREALEELAPKDCYAYARRG